jgi:filamentous hemagglutinin
MKDQGSYKETLAYNEITANNINITASQINTDVDKDNSQSVKSLLSSFNTNGQINYNSISLANESWDHSYLGLNQVGMGIIAIAAAVATGGAGAAVMGAGATGLAGAASVGISAAAATATTTASISAVNSGMNGGDLGDILEDSFKDTVSEDSLKNIALASAIAMTSYGAGEWIKDVKADYVKNHPNSSSWMSEEHSNLKPGLLSQSKVGVNAVKNNQGT